MKKDLHTASDSELYGLLTHKTYAEKAFRVLYERHSRRVYLYCLKILSDRQDAMDAFQQSFMKFHSVAQSGQQLDNIGGYILRIARNICIDRLRSQKESVEFNDILLATQDTPYEEKEFRQLVENAIDKLDFEYRDAFVLRELEGLNYLEMSAITGDSVAALKNRVWRAKNRIREILAPYIQELHDLK